MNVRDWLKRARFTEREIRELFAAKRKAYYEAVGCFSFRSTERVFRSFENISEERIIRLIDYETEIDRKIKTLLDTRLEILTAIDKLESSAEKILLTAYYVNGRTLEETAEDMGYCSRQIHRLHKNALKSIGDVIECH